MFGDDMVVESMNVVMFTTICVLTADDSRTARVDEVGSGGGGAVEGMTLVVLSTVALLSGSSVNHKRFLKPI